MNCRQACSVTVCRTHQRSVLQQVKRASGLHLVKEERAFETASCLHTLEGNALELIWIAFLIPCDKVLETPAR